MLNKKSNSKFFIFFLFSLILFLYSCSGGGGGEGGEASPYNTAFNIDKVIVDPVVFSRGSSEGVSFSWSLKNFTCPSGKYYLDVYLSRNETLDQEKDFLLFSISSNKTRESFQIEPSDFSEVYGGRWYVIFDFYCDSNSHTFKIFYPFTIKTKWTFMVYMDGDNSLNDYTDYDLEEMEEVGSSSEVNVVVQVDTLYETTKRYFIKPGERVFLQDLGELNMGNGDTLVDFVSWIFENYPAEHYVLVLWDHGRGFKRYFEYKKDVIVKDIAFDESSGGNGITLPELRNALSQIFQKIGRKIDIIGMDACLMAMAEVAYEIRDYAIYMVSSENTEPGQGWPYNSILEVLINNPDISPKNFAEKIVNNYIQAYSSADQATQSALDLTGIGNVTSSLNLLAQSLIDALNNDTNGTLKRTLQNEIFVNVQRFDDQGASTISLEDSYVDLYHLVYLIKENLPTFSEAALKVLKGLNATVIASENTGYPVSNAHGLSIWFPNNSTYQTYINRYRELLFAKDTVWDEFLHKMWE